ncbi:sigma 54-interacting transcriptional regulator [Polyangium jinanense]|uniref:Sigma 54-dependent Fis family transcriptional regulator n=1 Tax=Polyangium jinanense TaxID=2829994 RepID=A0A9X3X7P0_9BACT|nr:sigma 54-interacting transcriptional regulator [Polyangium jinanense]MDC3956038.1 sigma 54-dependent Fis family transcriptional regulator [Polyangium jinanense]MDC3982931.1 sigma 54-dependent Fis family transcriptional regulator [Polyangium jinanense]
MSDGESRTKLLGSAPSGSGGRRPVTEVIDATSGPSVRRIRKLRVVVVDAPDARDQGAAHVFAQDEVRVGSSLDVDVTLRDPAVSREHLAVRLGPHGFSLTDFGSTNGTFVGDLRIERVAITDDTLVRLGNSVLRLEPLAETVEQEISPRARFGRMLGASPAMREMFALLERVAASDLTVLLEGETGTGKELAAEGLHEASGRAGAFVAVNCGAIPRELLESELFGHEKGAFTGAVRERPGAFVAADRGTIFLDEVGELPLDMQAKLLRALERREVKAVGSDRSRSVDVRIVAATNRSLAREVQAGRFRQDLYYRLAVVIVRVPPLRTRIEDLRLLVDHIQDELARRRAASGLQPCARLDETAIAMLSRYDFPGNVRELRNIVERWAVLGAFAAPGEPAVSPRAEERKAEAPPSPETPKETAHASGVEANLLKLPYHEAKDAWVERFERAYVEAILAQSGGNVSRAAREAGVDRRHLQRLMARFGIRATSE